MWTLPRSPAVRVLELCLLGVLPVLFLVGSVISAAGSHTIAFDFDRAYAPAIHHVLQGSSPYGPRQRPRWARRRRSSIRRSAPSRSAVGGISAADGGHSRHGSCGTHPACDPLARRHPGLALLWGGASLDAHHLRHPPRHRQHADDPRRGAHVAVERSSAFGGGRPRTRDRTQALPLAACRLARDHKTLSAAAVAAVSAVVSCSFPGSRSKGPASCRIPTD